MRARVRVHFGVLFPSGFEYWAKAMDRYGGGSRTSFFSEEQFIQNRSRHFCFGLSGSRQLIAGCVKHAGESLHRFRSNQLSLGCSSRQSVGTAAGMVRHGRIDSIGPATQFQDPTMTLR